MFEENLSLKDLNVENLGLQIYKKINVVFHKVLIIAIQDGIHKSFFLEWKSKVTKKANKKSLTQQMIYIHISM